MAHARAALSLFPFAYIKSETSWERARSSNQILLFKPEVRIGIDVVYKIFMLTIRNLTDDGARWWGRSFSAKKKNNKTKQNRNVFWLKQSPFSRPTGLAPWAGFKLLHVRDAGQISCVKFGQHDSTQIALHNLLRTISHPPPS